jgi:hypothetical protein
VLIESSVSATAHAIVIDLLVSLVFPIRLGCTAGDRSNGSAAFGVLAFAANDCTNGGATRGPDYCTTEHCC